MTRVAIVLIGLAVLPACKREERALGRPDPGAAAITEPIRVSALQPGDVKPGAESMAGPYEGNAYAIAEGQRLYTSMNCVGCHFHGGGGIGPPLMDDFWLYGNQPAQIYQTIVEGRPNGMPSFGGKIPPQQVWQLVAYVRSLSGMQPMDAVSARDDHIQYYSTTPPR
jgi:cytochrome c oxidase cbb3-type subunit III